MLDPKFGILMLVRKFYVRVVEIGDKYGRDFKVTNTYDQPMIEFFLKPSEEIDAPEPGYFVSRYFYSTLVERDPTSGLLLDTTTDGLSLGVDEMATVMEALKTYFSSKR